MTGGLPPVLDDLRDQLREAAARDIAIESQVEARVADRVRGGRRRRWLLVTLGALVTFGGVAVAERTLDRVGPDLPADTLPRDIVPASDQGVVTSSAVADSGGGPPWALRVFTNRSGQDCVVLGRLMSGRLGTYDQTRTFRALPRHVGGVCDQLAGTGLLVAVQRRGVAPQRTIVFGLARDRQPVRVTVGGVTRTVTPGGLGTFIDVRDEVDRHDRAVVSTTVGGRTVRQALG